MKKSLLFPIVGVAVSLLSTTAFADKQLYPASMCVRWSSSEVVPYLASSAIYNTSSSKEMRVDCPIIHRNFNSSTGNNIDDADVGVIDANTSRNAKCWLSNRYQINSTMYGGSGGTRTTTGYGNHEQNLDFSGTGRHPENWYYIGCSIPPIDNGQKSAITFYSGED